MFLFLFTLLFLFERYPPLLFYIYINISRNFKDIQTLYKRRRRGSSDFTLLWPNILRIRVKALISWVKLGKGERERELTNGRQKNFLTSTRQHSGQDFINPIHKVVQVSSWERVEGEENVYFAYNLPCGCYFAFHGNASSLSFVSTRVRARCFSEEIRASRPNTLYFRF